MDALGLPVSFGKSAGLPPKPSKQQNAAAGPSRGGDGGGRGSRGVVGAGKKGRGRGRGGVVIAESIQYAEPVGLKVRSNTYISTKLTIPAAPSWI